MNQRISPAQRNALHSLDVNMYIYNSKLNGLERSVYRALERKGLVRLVIDDNGHGYWETFYAKR